MKKCLSFLVIAALFAACQPNNEVGTPFQAGQEVTLCANMPNAGSNGAQQLPGKQRVSGLDAGTQINLTWDEDDVILVKVGDKTAEFTLESGAGEAQATFKGVMPADGTEYSVQYPVADPDLSSQTYVANGFGKGLMKMATETNGTIDGGFTLKAQNALLGLQLTGDQAVGKIVVTNPANSKTYTLNCSGVTLSATATLFYIVVPAGAWGNGFTATVYASDDSELAEFSTSNAITFSAISATVMLEQEVVVVYSFSVSATQQVLFAPGNLQYTQSTDTWSFAENQYDYIGDDNLSGSELADKIDLFGWSGSDYNNFGVSTSNELSYFFGSFVDWGSKQIGSDASNTWRTLTNDEWEYLLNTRTNASSLKGVAQVNGVNGLVFLPDNWRCPAGVTFKYGFHSSDGAEYYAAYQTFTADQWSKLEDAGAVFLPAAGRRYSNWGVYDKQLGKYWSATEHETYFGNNSAYYLNFSSNEAIMDTNGRSVGYSVRLVKDL